MKQFATGCLCGAIAAFVLAGGFSAVAQTAGQSGQTFTAPFRVVSALGAPLLVVEERAGGPVMTLHGNNGGAITLGANGDRMAIDIRRSATNHASLILAGNEAVFTLESGGNGLLLTTDTKETGISVNRGDVEIGHFGQKGGRDAALRVFGTSGQPAVELGASNGGPGTIRAYDAAGDIAAFLQGTDGYCGNAGIMFNGKLVVLLDSNASMSGGKIETADGGGNVVFRAGAMTDGGGAMCIITNDGERCYGPYLP